jgi:hypothetical protein
MIGGGAALAAGVLIARQAFALVRDLRRYNTMREMSGEEPLMGANGESPVRFLTSIPADLMRYIRISRM